MRGPSGAPLSGGPFFREKERGKITYRDNKVVISGKVHEACRKENGAAVLLRSSSCCYQRRCCYWLLLLLLLLQVQ